MSTFIENQNWRYATKKFDANRIISDAELELLQEAIQLSTSSYGLQLFKVFIIKNPAIRAGLQPASWGQQQIVDASHLIVFANYTKYSEDDINEYIRLVTEARSLQADSLVAYSDFMKGTLHGLSETDFQTWTAKQTYLALGNLLNAAAELKIDVCPMEGFDSKQYNEILGLNALNLSASLVAPIGYRSADDATQSQKKVRKSISDLFITIN